MRGNCSGDGQHTFFFLKCNSGQWVDGWSWSVGLISLTRPPVGQMERGSACNLMHNTKAPHVFGTLRALVKWRPS